MMHIYDAEEESPDLMKRLLTARMVDRIEQDWWATSMPVARSPRCARKERRSSQLTHSNGTSDLLTGTNSTSINVLPRVHAPSVHWGEPSAANSTTL